MYNCEYCGAPDVKHVYLSRRGKRNCCEDCGNNQLAKDPKSRRVLKGISKVAFAKAVKDE